MIDEETKIIGIGSVSGGSHDSRFLGSRSYSSQSHTTEIVNNWVSFLY